MAPLTIVKNIRVADHVMMLAGAAAWLFFDLPLAWLLGPAMIGLILAIRSKPVGTDYVFGDCGRGLLGVAIGASITHNHIDWMLDHPALGVGLVIYVALGGGMGFLWLYRYCKWDRSSAWFAAFPGGMSEMVASAEAFGANIPKVALSHSLRIFCLVCGASFASYFFAGVTTGSLGFGEADPRIQPLVFLTMIVSVWGGKCLRIPAHSFMAPMFASLMMNLVFDIQLRLTDLILVFGQYFLGWSIASRFRGVSKNEVVEILKQVFVLLLLFLPIWGMMALLLDRFTDIDLASIILGLAPGGQAEIALIAMALNANLAVVMILHVLRSLTITMIGPIAFAFITKSKSKRHSSV